MQVLLAKAVEADYVAPYLGRMGDTMGHDLVGRCFGGWGVVTGGFAELPCVQPAGARSVTVCAARMLMTTDDDVTLPANHSPPSKHLPLSSPPPLLNPLTNRPCQRWPACRPQWQPPRALVSPPLAS